MALIILQPGATSSPVGLGSDTDNVFGTNDSEVVRVGFMDSEASGDVVLDPSFSRGGDTIEIAGMPGDFTISRNGSNIVLTSPEGGKITIPYGGAGATIVFSDDASRTLVFTDGTLTLGDQEIPSDGSTVDVDGEGSGGGGGGTPGETTNLSFGQDDITGTSGDDTFRAKVAQTQTGEQANQLGTGDFIDGAGGMDMLYATLQAASPLNGQPYGEIQPETTDVEIIRIEADQAYEAEANYAVEIDAEKMYGVERFESYYSDSDLVFYNVNTLGDDGLAGEDNGRPTSSITVCMDHTAGSNQLFDAADLELYFDADYLIPGLPDNGATQITLQLLDIDNQINNEQPLLTNPFDILYISIDGDAPISVFYDGNNNLSDVAAYQALVASINAGLAAAGLDTFTATLGGEFTVTDTDDDPGGPADGFNVIITDTAGSNITNLQFGATGAVPGDTDYHKQVFARTDDDIPQLIAVDICLDKAGQGGDGGDLIVGSMNTGGVEQFNVMLIGADNQDSSIALLSSTNNVLREVYVDSDDGGADLTIGNSNTFGPSPNGADYIFNDSCNLTTFRNNALTDVQVFDATALGAGSDVTLWANLSDDFTGKYLDLMDTQVNASADNVTASYLFGGGDDVFNMNISKANFAFSGAATREDFAFYTNTGSGDDVVEIQIGNGEFQSRGEFGGENWYTNHLLSENLTIETEDGDDFVWTYGSTAADIFLGDGADVAYTDNSGVAEFAFNCGYATWVFNSQNSNVNDLLSYGAASVSGVANLALTVQYMDFIVTVDLANSAGSVNGVLVNDLRINQAIKEAINEHPVLSDFLVAEDGPGRTLIVRNLVDGNLAATDLTVRIGDNGADLTPAQAGGDALYFDDLTPAQLANLGFAPDGTALTDGITGAGRYDAQFGNDDGYVLSGIDSSNINNNEVEGGLGNDEIALSSNNESIETLIINGVFSSLSQPGFGDHVLNFTAAVVDEDTDEVAEVQTITFDGDLADADTDEDDDPATDPTPYTIVTTVNGTDYEVLADADPASGLPTTDEEIAAAVAAAIAGDPSIDTVNVDGAEITITYLPGTNYPQATSVILPPPSETQIVDIDGSQVGDSTVTLNFAGNAYTIDVEDGDTETDIINALIAEINGPGMDPNVEATLGGGDDGASLTLSYFGATNPPLASLTGLNTDNFSVVQGDAFVAPTDPGVEVDEATLVQGAPAFQTSLGYDIIDLSGVIGNGGPDYFENTQQADGAEQAAIDMLIDSGDNGVLLIDTVENDDYSGSAATELARLQAIVTAADGTTQTGTDTSVIITVTSAPGDPDGTFGDFYQVVDGAAAGDATVSYMGRLYLGGSDLEDITGNFDALTIANFTPLSPTELIETYTGGMIV